MGRYWSPAGKDNSREGGIFGGPPEVGQVIARAHERRALRVTALTEIHQANWQPETHTAWRAAGSPPWETWRGRERGIHYRPAAEPTAKEQAFLHANWSYGEQYVLLHDPYPVCVACGLVWPCWCHETNQEATKATGELERLAAIRPGQCWACGEYIRPRQQRIVFEGENLLLPGAPPAVFHTAALRNPRTWGTCYDDAKSYEKRWIAAEPDQQRPYRVHCPGLLRDHTSTVECTYDRCPGRKAGHEQREPCTAAVCAPDGKWGWSASYQVAGEPAHPREVLPTTTCGHPDCRGRLAVTA